MASLDVNVEQLSAYNERILECVLLYTPDETIFPVPTAQRVDEPPEAGAAAADETVPVVKKQLPPPTFLLPGPPGSTYMKVPSWRGEQLRGAFAQACPAIHEMPPSGMGTPFSDLQQLSIFAFPKVTRKRRCIATAFLRRVPTPPRVFRFVCRALRCARSPRARSPSQSGP